MGQEEILDLLEKVGEPLTVRQISEKLNSCGSKVNHLIRKLMDHNEVESFEIDREMAKKIFTDHIPTKKIRMYYIPKSG